MERNRSKTDTGKTPRGHFRRGLAMLLPAAALWIAACTSTPTAPPTTADGSPVRYMVTADKAPFFKYGPAQQEGADLQLKKGEIVTMVERHYGYSRVLDPDGEAGYIPTDQIAPAPSQTATIVNPIPKNFHGAGSHAAHGSPDFEQPNDATLPSKQPPSDQPAPSFRT